jgi:cytidyltransferase-like protein
MAHKSLSLKLKKRKESSNMIVKPQNTPKKSFDAQSLLNSIEESSEHEADSPEFEQAEMKMVHFADNEIIDGAANLNFKYKKRRHSLKAAQTNSLEKAIAEEDEEIEVVDTRVDKVYTVGCFDLFHDGHVNLIRRMREIGKKVIVGVHDSRSIYKLKNRVPVDSTEKRMLNVKKHADEVKIFSCNCQF